MQCQEPTDGLRDNKTKRTMKEINFKAIEVEDIEGNKQRVDIAKALGNQLYMQGLSIEECDLGRKIYYSEGELELDENQVRSVLRITSTYPYLSRHAIEMLLS